MRSFRARRQGSQWGLDDDDDIWAAEPAAAGLFDGSDALVSQGSSGTSGAGQLAGHTGGLRRGESMSRIMVPASDDRELSGGRLVNEEAVYNMRKKWISDRLIER